MSERDLPSRYEPRSIRFLELWKPGDWRVKVYGISARNDRPERDLVAVAKELALKQFPRPAVTENRYGVGLLIVHEGGDGNYVLVDWWLGKHKLKSYVYSADPGRVRPEEFRDVTSTGLTGCVWELHVLDFERRAWVHSVLAREGGPDLDEYLVQRFEGSV